MSVAGTASLRVVDHEAVAAVRAALPSEEETSGIAAVLGLLSDPTRLTLLLALLKADEMCVGDLAAVTGTSESAVSHALRLLRAHRVVAVRRSARLAYYRLADSHVRLLLDVAREHADHATPVAALVTRR